MPQGQEERKGYNPLLKNYPDSVKINRVSIGAETLYTRLLARSDDHADYDADPRLILAGLYGKRWKNRQVSEGKIKKWIDELEAVNLIVKYQVEGDIYLHLNDCFKTLRSDVKRDVRYPLRPDHAKISSISSKTQQNQTKKQGISSKKRKQNELFCSKPSDNLQDKNTNTRKSDVISTKTNICVTDTGRTRPPNQTRLDKTRLDKYVHLFNKFWKAYPRKDAKQRAIRWFEKYKPSETDVGKIIFTIERQKKKGQRLCCKRQFMPLPETWLNDGDWRDAPTQVDLDRQHEAQIARDKVALEKEKQQIRESVIGIKLKGMTTNELKNILTSNDSLIKREYLCVHWLIKEILAKRKGGK